MDPGRGRDARWRRYPLPCDALNIEVPPSASSTWVAQYRAACSTRSDRVCIAAPRGHPRALPTRDQPFLLLRLQKRFTYHGLSTRGECMQMKTTAGPKRKYNSPSHPGMPRFKVIEIAAAAVSCAASGGLSLERQLDIVRVRQMQDLAKCGMLRCLQQVSIGRNGTSSRRKAAHWSVDYCSPTSSKWPSCKGC